jgi:hypothetical protein
MALTTPHLLRTATRHFTNPLLQPTSPTRNFTIRSTPFPHLLLSPCSLATTMTPHAKPLTTPPTVESDSADSAASYTRFAGAMPKEEIGAAAFLKEHPTFDGRGCVVAIFDTGVDPAATGLSVRARGLPLSILVGFLKTVETCDT